MKLSIIFFIVLLFPLFSYSSYDNNTFNISSYLRLDKNAGEVNLPTININLATISTKTLSFFINEKDFTIFSNNISEIKTNSTNNQIESIKLDQKNKKIQINFSEEISGKIDIYGIKIRVYDEKINSAKIALDYDNDNEIDLYSGNVIDLYINDRFRDTLKPQAVYNVSNNLYLNDKGTYNVDINWSVSPDLDVNGTIVKVFKNNSYGNILEQFIGHNENQSFSYHNMDLNKDIYRIEVYSRDTYYSNDDPYILNLDKSNVFKTEKEGIKKDIVEKEPVEKEVNENDSDNKGEDIKELQKTNPSFKKYKFLYKITSILDKYIENKLEPNSSIEKRNEVILIRNQLVSILENIEIADKENRKSLILDFKALFLKFKEALY